MEHHLSISTIVKALRVAWHTANTAILTAGEAVLIGDKSRFDGVEVLGVDEHVWRHATKGDKYVTVIIDLTPVRNQTRSARLLDIVPGRSKQVFKTWFSDQLKQWRDRIDVVAMDGFTCFKTSTSEGLPTATAVLNPFHVVPLVDETRRRTQRRIYHRHGCKGDHLYSARHTLLTGMDLLNDKQIERLEALLVDQRHIEVQATWRIYQQRVAAYRDKERSHGKQNSPH